MLGEPNNTEDGGTGAGDQRLEGSEGTREDDTGTRADSSTPATMQEVNITVFPALSPQNGKNNV